MAGNPCRCPLRLIGAEAALGSGTPLAVVVEQDDEAAVQLLERLEGQIGNGIESLDTRAVRTESATALGHLWGVSVGVVWRWRKAIGIGREGTPGSTRLVQAAAQLGANAMKAKGWTEEEREQKRQQAIEGGYGAYFPVGSKIFPGWTADELAMLGTVADWEIAKQIGRTREAVRLQRCRLGIANPRDRRKRTDR
jgi:hypothetical protein